MEKRKWEKFKTEHRSRPKRKPDKKDTILEGWKRQSKKLKRMEKSEELCDLPKRWKWADGMCMKA